MWGNSLGIGRVIGGISKTIGLVNQIIPLYKETKPIISNARNALSLIKEFSNTGTKRVIDNTHKNMSIINKNINQNNSKKNIGPTFFS